MTVDDDLPVSSPCSLPSPPHALLLRRAASSGALGERGAALDAWVVPAHTAAGQRADRGSGRRTETMTQPLVELVEQFCNYQRKQRGRSDGGVRTYRWILEQFLRGHASLRPGRRSHVLLPSSRHAYDHSVMSQPDAMACLSRASGVT
jgi:hypothetical protein